MVSSSSDHESESPLAQSLLHEAPRPSIPPRPFAYPWWGILLVSVFIAYHVTILLVHNLPSKGLSQKLYQQFNRHASMNRYMRATGSSQGWAMFAPNPHRSNIFMRVFVKDKDGEVWDLKHDVYGRREYPYLFYDRMGKINRRIVDEKGYRRHYAAWVCREWERTHGGEAADEVQFVKIWTVIPKPREAYRYMGFDPMKLHLHQRKQESVRCRTTRNAQLPPELRERFGLPESDAPVIHEHLRTWWDRQESEGARR